jgi:hypothetical protein
MTWEHYTFWTERFLGLFRNISLKISFLRTLALKYPNTFQFLVEAALHIDFILCWSMNVQNNDMTPATSQYYVRHAITNELNFLSCCFKKKPESNSWFSLSFHKKNIFSLAGLVLPPSHRTSCSTTKSNLVQRSSIISGTGAPIWSKTNFGPTGHHHLRSSPILRSCVVPGASAILKCILEVVFCEGVSTVCDFATITSAFQNGSFMFNRGNWEK